VWAIRLPLLNIHTGDSDERMSENPKHYKEVTLEFT
jgi:hypothetical protein